MQKILLTGASGLIGKCLLTNLCKGNQVYALSRNRVLPETDMNELHYISFDLSKTWDYQTLPQKIDIIIHLAQSEHFRDFPGKSVHLFHVNTLSTLRLLDYALNVGVKTFIYASSGGIYGYSDRGFTEDVNLHLHGDLGFYLRSKLCSEIISDCYTSYLNVIILRFFFVYGPGQKKNMLIPRLVLSVIDGKPIILQGSDGIRINPTYVEDAAGAIIKSINLDSSQKINVGGPDVLSMREIGETIGKIFHKKPKFEIQRDLKPQNIIGDISKMKRLIGRSKWHFAEGLRQYESSLRE